MKFRRSLIVFVVSMAALLGAAATNAQVKRPYHDGPVWDIGFIRVKPGMDTAYMTYLATEWKKQQEAMLKGGVIVSYKVIASEPHNPGDFTLMLMTEYKDMASMEANSDKADQISQTLQDDKQSMEGYKQRADIRDVLGNRLSREIILEPKK